MERLAKEEKRIVFVFEEGLKTKTQETIDEVKKLKKTGWVVSFAVIGAVLA